MKPICLACAIVFSFVVSPEVRAQETGRQAVTITAVGDIMMGTTFPEQLLPPRDGLGIFDPVKDVLAPGDIILGNLEGPLAEEGISIKCKNPDNKTCYAFRTPPRYASYLKDAGFTSLHIANNHASDFGQDGLESTLSALTGTGIQPVGGRAVANFTVRGRRIAEAGFFYFSSPYAYSILDLEEASRIVRSLKSNNDLVIVSFHGGAEGSRAQHVSDMHEEFLGEDRGNVIAFAHTVIDAGADLVIGHGPHVLRALELYRGKLVAYSLGNFLVYERFNLDGPNGVSVVLRASLDPVSGDFLEGRLVPVSLGTQGLPAPDPSRAGLRLIKKLTREDFGETGLIIEEDGLLMPRQAKAGPKPSPAGTDPLVTRVSETGKSAAVTPPSVH